MFTAEAAMNEPTPSLVLCLWTIIDFLGLALSWGLARHFICFRSTLLSRSDLEYIEHTVRTNCGRTRCPNLVPIHEVFLYFRTGR